MCVCIYTSVVNAKTSRETDGENYKKKLMCIVFSWNQIETYSYIAGGKQIVNYKSLVLEEK